MNDCDDKSSSPTRVLVVLNPLAGHCNARLLLRRLEMSFRDAGWEFDLYRTTGNEDLPSVVRERIIEGYNLVVVAGGDGTVSDVAEALVHTGVPMGIIPVGTGNVVARELWIPINPARAIRLIVGRHRVTCVDAMSVKGRYYFLNLSAGFASLMIRDTKRRHKRIYGVAAYLWTGFIKLFGFQQHKFEIEVDSAVHEYWATEVSIANSGILAMRPFNLGTEIRMDDGRLDICVIRARTFFDYLKLLVTISMRLHKYDKNIEYIHARKSLTIRADDALIVQGDGEVIGEIPLSVKVVPAAVQVIVPPRRKTPLW